MLCCSQRAGVIRGCQDVTQNSSRVCSIPLIKVPGVAAGAEKSPNLNFLGLFPPELGGCRVGTQLCIHRQIEYEKQLMKALWSLTAVLVFTHRICVRMLWPHPPELKEWDLRRFKYVQIHHSSPAKGIINSFISSVCNALKSQTESFTRKKKLGQLRNEGWCVLVSAALCSSS